jgi:transcriptional regulator with XRE-family HTH domain
MEALQSRVPRIRNPAPHELRDPGVAHVRPLAQARPVAAAALQEALDFGVQVGRHTAIIVKHSSAIKEHFPKDERHPRRVAEKDINEVVADNLAYWMREAKLTQAAVAQAAGVSQKTISNYLNPQQRMEGAKGKPGSPKLYELDLIAKALGVELWQLTRAMTESERAIYEALEKAYRDLVATARQLPAGEGAASSDEMTAEERARAEALLKEAGMSPKASTKQRRG